MLPYADKQIGFLNCLICNYFSPCIALYGIPVAGAVKQRGV